MHVLKALVFSFALASPIASYAYAAGDALPEAVVQEHQKIIETYAKEKQKSLPAVVQYKYGMDLDVAKVVRLSPDVKACKVMPQLMTYENSEGELRTVEYRIMSGCRGKN